MGLIITTNTGPPNGVRPRPISTRTAGRSISNGIVGFGSGPDQSIWSTAAAARPDVGVRGSERRARQPALGGWLEAVRRKTEPDCLRRAPRVPAEACANAANPGDGWCTIGRRGAVLRWLRPAREDALCAVLPGQHPLDEMRKPHEPTPLILSFRAFWLRMLIGAQESCKAVADPYIECEFMVRW
jgi:hypothetical protein